MTVFNRLTATTAAAAVALTGLVAAPAARANDQDLAAALAGIAAVAIIAGALSDQNDNGYPNRRYSYNPPPPPPQPYWYYNNNRRHDDRNWRDGDNRDGYDPWRSRNRYGNNDWQRYHDHRDGDRGYADNGRNYGNNCPPGYWCRPDNGRNPER